MFVIPRATDTMQAMTATGLLAASAVLLVVEANPAAPRSEADAVEAQVANTISSFDLELRSLGDLQTLPGAAPLLAEANSAMEEGIRAYVEVELETAVTSLDHSIDLYRQAGADLWGSEALARAHLNRGLVALALGEESEAGSHFSQALNINPSLMLEKGTYAPPVISAFEKARAAFLQTGFQPRPAEVWGGAARRLGADGVVVVRVQRKKERTVAMSYLKVAPEGAMSTEARAASRKDTPRQVGRTAEKLLEAALGPRPVPKWRKWAWIGGGTLATGILILIAGAASQPKVDTSIVVPTPTPSSLR